MTGREALCSKIAEWGLLFSFSSSGPLLRGFSETLFNPAGGADYHKSMTFLLSGPYAKAEVSARLRVGRHILAAINTDDLLTITVDPVGQRRLD